LHRLIYIIAFITAGLFSCKTHTASTTLTGAQHPDSIFASIERSPCFGRCPVFTAVIYNNGKAVYEGRTGVTRLGRFTGTASGEQMKLLEEKAAELSIDTLSNEYVNEHLADFPSHRMSILIKGNLKTVYVMETDPPSVIPDFESFLEKILDQVEWTKEDTGGQ
jgi:hypothetical protein